MLCHDVHMDVTALQERMAENVRVLLAVTGLRSQAELARRAGWEAAKVTRLLKGTQEWTLSDIVTVGEILGFDDPGLLMRPLSEVVGAVHPAAAGVNAGVRKSYPSVNAPATALFPQVSRSIRRYLPHLHRANTLLARPVTPRRLRHLRAVTTPTAASSEIANRVTAAGGL